MIKLYDVAKASSVWGGMLIIHSLLTLSGLGQWQKPLASAQACGHVLGGEPGQSQRPYRGQFIL
jgi:hypothetical protein